MHVLHERPPQTGKSSSVFAKCIGPPLSSNVIPQIGYIMDDTSPKLFISYSWSNPEHEQFVLDIAAELVESGVDVILDKWNLKEGHDSYVFMEKMVTDPEIKKVAIICDKTYASKADKRSGGVGTETQIISKEVYDKTDQNKFVAVLVERDDEGKAYLPTYYKSRIYIDLSDPDHYATNFEQLQRWVYDEPLHVKPKLGSKPKFLSGNNNLSLGTTAKFKRALDSIVNNKDYCNGAMDDYYTAFTNGLEDFRITDKTGEFDDKVVDNIDSFLPYRNEAIELCFAIAKYRNTEDTIRQLHRFLESLIPFMDRPENVTSWQEWDFDNYKFIVHELFLYAIAIFLKYECFDSVSYLLKQDYYVEQDVGHGRNAMVPFSRFREHLRSLRHRSDRLNLQRLSLHADLLEQRSKTSGLSFSLLMQADFVLFMRDSIMSLSTESYQGWWPETLLYLGWRGRVFEIFARAQSKEYFNKMKCILGIEQKEDLQPILQAFQKGEFRVPSWEGSSFNPRVLLKYDELSTKP